MKVLFALSSLLISIIAVNAHADYNGTISQIACHANGITPVCLVSLNGPSSQPACANSGWKYSFDGTTSEGKNILSILLAAQMARQPVTIGGKGTCTLAGYAEDLRHVYMTTP